VQEPVEIVLVDNQRTLAEALRLFLEQEEDLAIIGVSRKGDAGLEILRGNGLRVLVLDLSSRSDVAEVIDETTEASPGVGVVALSTADHAETIRAARQLDAATQVVQASSSEQLATALRESKDGGGMLVSYTPSSPQYRRDPEIELLVSTLSRRERNILELITAGYSNQRIAEACYLSMHTVRTHIQSILVKLGVHSKLEAAIFAVQHRLVSLDGDRSSYDEQPTSASSGR
jgi:DNA-binding NarL/FixJ family response regulator